MCSEGRETTRPDSPTAVVITSDHGVSTDELEITRRKICSLFELFREVSRGGRAGRSHVLVPHVDERVDNVDRAEREDEHEADPEVPAASRGGSPRAAISFRRTGLFV